MKRHRASDASFFCFKSVKKKVRGLKKIGSTAKIKTAMDEKNESSPLKNK